MKITIYHRKEYGGTGLYRLHLPHELMAQWGHTITFTDSLDPKDYDCDLFIASKSWFVSANTLVPKLQKKGIKCIIDFDDYWILPQSHLLYHSYKVGKTSRVLVDGLRMYDYVMCTTPALRDEISLINPKVEVFENAIDPNNPQFSINPKAAKNVRFGYIAGHCHKPDLMLLDNTPQHLTGKFSIHLFGYDDSQVYAEFADILSGRKTLMPDKFFLYRMASARAYTQFYNHIDVAIAPLVADKFNSLKSELKMVEAGFMKKALVVSDVKPYSDLIKHDNCLKVVHKHQWVKQMQRLINNPDQIEDLAEALYDTVKDKYDLHTVTRRREQWYKTL